MTAIITTIALFLAIYGLVWYWSRKAARDEEKRLMKKYPNHIKSIKSRFGS